MSDRQAGKMDDCLKKKNWNALISNRSACNLHSLAKQADYRYDLRCKSEAASASLGLGQALRQGEGSGALRGLTQQEVSSPGLFFSRVAFTYLFYPSWLSVS